MYISLKTNATVITLKCDYVKYHYNIVYISAQPYKERPFNFHGKKGENLGFLLQIANAKCLPKKKVL